MEHPYFPAEIFAHIIDLLGRREYQVHLTLQQYSTLKACALVCQLFLPLSRAHLHRYAVFGLDGDLREKRLDRLVQMLEESPNIKCYIRELVIDLERHLPLSEEGDFQDIMVRRTNVLTGIPAVESITICYSAGIPLWLSEDNPAGSFCHRIIEAHAIRGTLRTLNVKKMVKLPFTIIFASTALSTLCLDRCELPTLTHPIPSIKSLTLRKINFPVQILSFFPNLEELHLIRTDIKRYDESATSLYPPPFGIKVLTFERCSRSGYLDLSFNRPSISALLDYFYSKAEEEGVSPFSRLTVLGALLFPDFPLMEPLFRDAPIQSFVYGALPAPMLTILGLINYMRNSNYSISLRYRSGMPLMLPDTVITSFNALMWNIVPVSDFESIECSHILERPAFGMAHSTGPPQDYPVLDLWASFISALMDGRPGFAEIEEIEIFMMVGNATPHLTVDRDSMTDEIAEEIANKMGTVMGTCFDDFDGTKWRKARMAFIFHAN